MSLEQEPLLQELRRHNLLQPLIQRRVMSDLASAVSLQIGRAHV